MTNSKRMKKKKRNDWCPCGSDRKVKKYCDSIKLKRYKSNYMDDD